MVWFCKTERYSGEEDGRVLFKRAGRLGDVGYHQVQARVRERRGEARPVQYAMQLDSQKCRRDGRTGGLTDGIVLLDVGILLPGLLDTQISQCANGDQ